MDWKRELMIPTSEAFDSQSPRRFTPTQSAPTTQHTPLHGMAVARRALCWLSFIAKLLHLRFAPGVPTKAAVCLLMSDTEPLKPSNTGWLIADVIPDTYAFA